MAIAELIYNALITPNSRYFYVCPTYKQAKMIAWRMLHECYFNLPQELRMKKNESDLSIEIRDIHGKGTSIIELRGADDPDKLRGVKLNGCILDEYADMKKNVFEEIIRPALADLRGWCWFIGTPRGYDHFFELFNYANSKGGDWSSFRFTTYDNPYIPKDEVDKAKEDLNEDYFAQEYMAEFRRFTGLVYKDFDRFKHVIDPFDVTQYTKYRTIDFGTTNPFCCLWIAHDSGDNWYIYDEHYEANQTTEYHAGIINGRSIHQEFMATYRDPSAKQLELDFAQYGIYTIPAINVVNPKDIELGISKVQSHLKTNPLTGTPRLFVFNNCVNTIREFETYKWEEHKRDEYNAPNIPMKKNDHAMDALRYFANTYSPPTVRLPINEYLDSFRQKTNSYTGY